MKVKRVDRLNSLLKEVISEVILKDVSDPNLTSLVTITSVDISKDMQHAKVFVSVIGNDEEKNKAIKALNQAKGYISVLSSKKVVMRYFPTLHFVLDDSVEKHMHIDKILKEIEEKKSQSNE